MRITALLPLQDAQGNMLEEEPPLQQLYDDFIAAGRERETPLLHAGKAVIVHARIFLKWVVTKKRRLPYNPAEGVDVETPKGRVVIWDQDEWDALLQAAEVTGFHSIGWAARLSRELSWQRSDILSLTFSHFQEATTYDQNGNPKRRVRVDKERNKTGNRTMTTLTADGVALYDEIMAWHRTRLGENVRVLPTCHLLLIDDIQGYQKHNRRNGKPWSMDHFTHCFAETRAKAEELLGRPIPKFFADLRDSAITEMREAKLPKEMKISRSQHSPETSDRLEHEHYGLVTPDISDEAADMLDAHRAMKARAAEALKNRG